MTRRNSLRRISVLSVGLIVAIAGKAYSGSINGSTIVVSGLPNSIPGNDYITVTLNGFSATNTSDVDVVVVVRDRRRLGAPRGSRRKLPCWPIQHHV